MMLLIPLFLSKQMQGFWFTFGSLSALSIFADLGFTAIVTLFAAHEFAYLRIGSGGLIEGDPAYLDRLKSFFRFAMKWGIMVVIITFPIIFIVGYLLMSGEPVLFSWRWPWLVFVCGAGINFVSNIALSFFEGCGLISKAQKIRFFANVVYAFTVIVSLLSGFNLYSIAIGTSFNAIILLIVLLKTFKPALIQLLAANINPHPWRKEVFRLLWRYAISWSSGYFIFQLFTPVAFRFYGSAAAGQVGITITLVTAIFSISNIWMYVANPKLNMYIAKKEWVPLNAYFKKHLLLSAATFILGSCACLIIFILAPDYKGFKDRFMDVGNVSLLLFAWFLQLIINSLALYLRAFKEEPLVIPSLVSAVYLGITTILIGFFLPSKFIMAGFYTAFFFGMPWVISIFLKKLKTIKTGNSV